VRVFLGRWQLDRLAQRRARNAVLAARLAFLRRCRWSKTSGGQCSPARVVAQGVYDFSAERTWPAEVFKERRRSRSSPPLRLADGSAVLVDRGWAPSPDAFHVDHTLYGEPDTATVTGMALIPPRGRGTLT